MAIITLAAPISGIRGKVGGIVYSAGKSGPYVKPWSKGANPRTVIQAEQRQVLSAFAQSWKSLTTAERLTWDIYAALAAQDKVNSLGETYSASGFNWYVAINSNLARTVLAQRTIAPTIAVPGTPITIFARFEDDSFPNNSFVRMTGASPNLTDYHTAWVKVSNNRGVGAPGKRTQWMATGLLDGNKNLNFQGQVNLKYGTVQTGMVAFYEIAVMNAHGRVGARASRNATAP